MELKEGEKIGEEKEFIMSYKIAVASSDEINVDETFGQAERFIIYEADGKSYSKLEEREAIIEDEAGDGSVTSLEETGCNKNTSGCGSENGCGSGGGCGGAVPEKLKYLYDCRAVVCKKIGTQVQKQLEKKAISYFDVTCTVKEALDKITFYYNRIDNHISLRDKS